MKFSTKASLLGFILFLWIVIVLVGYYYVHKPIDLDQFVALGRSILSLLLAFWITLLCGGLGRKIYPSCPASGAERAVLEAAIGFGVFGLFWLLLGALHAYSTVAGWALLVFASLWLWRSSLSWASEFQAIFQGWNELSGFGKGIVVISILLVSIQLLIALAPPLKWDALSYHLDLPRRYLSAGGIEFLPDQPFWGQPQLVEMNYTWALSLLNLSTATTLNWMFGMIFLLGVQGAVARRVNPTAGWVAVAALLAGVTTRGLLRWGYVDLFSAFYGLAILILLIEMTSRADFRVQDGVILGLLAGFAAGVKYTNLALFPLVGLMLIGFLPATPKKRLRAAGIALAVGAAAFLPWLVRNGITTGNPLYPYFFATPWVSQASLDFETRIVSENPDVLRLLLLPVDLTWWGVEASSGYAADIGVLLLLLAVPGGVLAWKTKPGKMVLTWIAYGWLVMALGSLRLGLLSQTRLFLAFLPAVAILAGLGWQVISQVRIGQVRMERLAGAVILLVLGFSLLQDVTEFAHLNPAGYLVGIEDADSYLNRGLGPYAEAMRYLHENSPDKQTLFLWEPRSLYAPLAASPDPWLNRWHRARQDMPDGGEVLEEWRNEGYERLLIYRSGAEFERENRDSFTPADWLALDALLSGLSLEADVQGVYQVYALGE